MIFLKIPLILLCISITIGRSCANHILSELNALNYQSLILKVDFAKYLKVTQNAADGYDDSKCVQQFTELRRSFNESELWAVEVMDASGKTPSGILAGNTYSLGDFDQCVGIRHEIAANNEFNGQYCLMDVYVDFSEIIKSNALWRTNRIEIDSIDTEETVSLAHRRLPRPTPTNLLTFGICGPATCSPELLIEMLKGTLDESNIDYVSDIAIAPITCQRRTKLKLKTEDILVISFFCLIGFIMLASTIYDIVKTRQNKPRNELLIAFSMYTNASKIMATNRVTPPNEITCLHGFRSLSMFWVITSHLYDQHWNMPFANTNYIFEWITNYYSMVILSTNKAVDTFLFMSALLLTRSMLKQLRNSNGKFNYARLYFHRYIRVTPLFAALILMQFSFFKYLGSGPVWYTAYNGFNTNCRKYWWSALLHIQNYVNQRSMCASHVWYLSADMQLYVLSPPFIYLLFRYKNKILPMLLAFGIACTGVVIYFFIKYDLAVNLIRDAEGDASNDLRRRLTYHPTHARAGSWIVGMIFGYILYQVDGKKVRMKKWIVWLGWPISIAILLASILANYPLQQMDQTSSSLLRGLYHALPRVAWPAALSFVVFASHFGYGGIVNWFLSLPQWQPISRLTYAMYITHIIPMLCLERTIRVSRYISDWVAFHAICGHLVITVMIAFLFSMAFEYPVFELEKLLYRRKKAPETSSTTAAN